MQKYLLSKLRLHDVQSVCRANTSELRRQVPAANPEARLSALFPDHCRQLVKALDCNLLCYDYSGYGQSSGETPSVSDCYADIDACLAWLLESGKQMQDVVLYGQSVGSGPSVNLAARTPGLAGMILHSPLCSGMLSAFQFMHKERCLGAVLFCLQSSGRHVLIAQ